MTSDIVGMLRIKAKGESNEVGDKWGDWICDEAADIIESLRSRLAIESKEREGREALLRENESLRARLAEAEARREADFEIYHQVYMVLLNAGTDKYLGALEQAQALVARAENAEAALEEAERDAALGRIAIRFVDRAGDYCEVDPAERICDEFSDAMAAEVERQWQARVARDAHLSRKEQP